MVDSPIASRWFYYWRRRPEARVRLFCLPYAGGGASIFRTWQEILPAEIEVCPIQLPGRENRLAEQAYFSLPSSVEAIAQEIQAYLDIPFAFFGHSMGAIISFELARYLRHRGDGTEPLHLFVSGHRAPQCPDLDPPTHHLPDTEFVEKLRRLEGTPEEVLQNAELLELLIPLLRADFALCETYRYLKEKPLRCAISALGGLQDSEVSRDTLAAWREQTNGSFKLRFFPGNHFYLQQDRQTLLQTLAQDLFNHL